MRDDFKKELEILIERESKAWRDDQIFHRLNDIAIREIFAMKHEVNMLRDEKGMVIPGTGRVITNEEKKMVFDFMLENDLPFTKKMYSFILNAYISNELELSEVKSLNGI